MSKWDERFNSEEYIYGKKPNEFLESVVNHIPTGKILCLGEGEGRNAVFLSKKGYEVTAVDSSSVGLEKTRKLANENKVIIETIHQDLSDYVIEQNGWNGIISIFCHLPISIRKRIHKACVEGLNHGGVFILEGYSPRQLEYYSGGPKQPKLLMNINVLKKELTGLKFEISQEIVREVLEGNLHTGLGSVVQILGIKL